MAGIIDNCGAGFGEAHSGAKTERGAACGVGGAVATEPVYPDNSHEVLTVEVERFIAAMASVRLVLLNFAITLPELYVTMCLNRSNRWA